MDISAYTNQITNTAVKNTGSNWEKNDYSKASDEELMEACKEFEKLPLLENVEILRNILYSGVWTKFRLGMSYKKENGGEYADDK